MTLVYIYIYLYPQHFWFFYMKYSFIYSPRMPKHFCVCRWTLETIGSLEPRKSALEDDFEEEEKEDEDQLMAELEDDADEKVQVNTLQGKN